MGPEPRLRTLVTGASRGLGLAIAREMARGGAALHLVARDPAALQLAAEAVLVEGAAEVHLHAADLTDRAQVKSAAADALACGPIGVLVNNAAVLGPVGRLEETDFEAWCAAIEVDLLAPALLCHLLIPGMRRLGRGKIVNLSGGGATGPRPFVSAYAVAKCALVRLTETLAVELSGTGIDVNAVAPGALATRLQEDLIATSPSAAPLEHARALEVMASGGAPLAEAAALVAWLASPESDGITGRLLSAQWDDWRNLPQRRSILEGTDIYTLRRIVPADRGWDA